MLCLFAAVVLGLSDLHAAIEATYPLSRTMGETIDQLRQWAKHRARAATSRSAEAIPPRDVTVPQLAQERRAVFLPPSRDEG